MPIFGLPKTSSEKSKFCGILFNKNILAQPIRGTSWWELLSVGSGKASVA